MNYNAIPPDRTKYGFGTLAVKEEKIIIGDYRLIRIAANTYSKKHNIKIKAINNGKSILLKRIK